MHVTLVLDYYTGIIYYYYLELMLIDFTIVHRKL